VTGRFELDFGTCRKTKPTASMKKKTVIPIALVKRSSHQLVQLSELNTNNSKTIQNQKPFKTKTSILTNFAFI
jgi:hypothetical protein